MLEPGDSDSNILVCLDVGSVVSRGDGNLTPTDHTVTGFSQRPLEADTERAEGLQASRLHAGFDGVFHLVLPKGKHMLSTQNPQI